MKLYRATTDQGRWQLFDSEAQQPVGGGLTEEEARIVLLAWGWSSDTELPEVPWVSLAPVCDLDLSLKAAAAQEDDQ